MMKRALPLVMAALLLSGTAAMAANPEPFSVLITLRQAITISKVDDLDFGTVDTGANAYIVTPTAGAQAGAGIAAIAASFDILGENSSTADVFLVPNPVTINFGANTIDVNLTPENTTHTFTGATEQFYVGGDLTLDGTEPAGLYTGSATLELVYQ